MDHQASSFSRRTVLGAAAGLTIAAPVLAQAPAPKVKGPRVFMDYDQAELDAAYDQVFYAPNLKQLTDRYASNSELTRARLGAPKRFAYGPTAVEGLDVFTTKRPNAPIHIFIHGGAWLGGLAKNYAFPAETLVKAGAHFVVLDFIAIKEANGDLGVMADQVRRAIAWTYKNAASFGGDASRIYVSGHSSGGHLAGVALTTDWAKDFGLPADIIKGGVCCSGMYELTPVRLSKRGAYVKFTDAMVEAMSSQRHLDKLNCPVTILHGTLETPEFQRQNRDFVLALKKAGKPVQFIVAEGYNHFEIMETLSNPYVHFGRAVLEQMKLGQA
jgi:arylformamidase